MFNFDYLISICFRIWIALFIGMILRTVITSIIKGMTQGYMISTIKQNVNRRIEEYDRDLQKYFNYEVDTDDLSNMHEQNEKE